MLTIIILAVVAVVVSLVIGLAGFLVGGEFNRKYGNLMMRLRILFQVIAVGLVLVMVFMTGWGRQ